MDVDADVDVVNAGGGGDAQSSKTIALPAPVRAMLEAAWARRVAAAETAREADRVYAEVVSLAVQTLVPSGDARWSYQPGQAALVQQEE